VHEYYAGQCIAVGLYLCIYRFRHIFCGVTDIEWVGTVFSIEVRHSIYVRML
jgi:hypothetical protein